MLKQKKEQKPEEYDISSNDGSLDESDSSSDSDDAFVISKAKERRKSKQTEPPSNNNLRGDVDELKTMILELANMQKKQNK